MFSASSECDTIYKIVVVGNTSVGKSSLVSRFTKDMFQTKKPTVGVEYSSKIVERGSQKIKVQLWDTAGQERFRALTSQFYRHAKGVLICFDLTERNTFDTLDCWISQYDQLVINFYQNLRI